MYCKALLHSPTLILGCFQVRRRQAVISSFVVLLNNGAGSLHSLQAVSAGLRGGKRACSSVERLLTGLLHTCHGLCLRKCQPWLTPHLPLIWDTLFAVFEAFCEACRQLCAASCTASAQEEQQCQQQGQQQLPSQQPAGESKPDGNQEHTVSERIALFNAMAQAGRSQGSRQQPAGAKACIGSAADAGKTGSAMPGSRRLLVLLSKCVDMEALLAQLVPGFLAVLSFEGSHQVRGVCVCTNKDAA